MNDPSAIPVFTLYGETDDVPDLVHVEPLSERSAPNNWTISAHRHADVCQVFLIEQGHVSIAIDDQKFEVTEEAFAFVPAQVVHALELLPGTDGTVFSFPTRNFGSVGPIAERFEQALSLPFSGAVTQEIRMFTQSLMMALEAQGPYRGQKIIGLSNAILASLAEVSLGSGDKPLSASQQRMERLGVLVREHMEEGWNVADYAAALAVSSGHLSRICRSVTGLGAQAYVEGLIMNEACRYLVFTDLPVAEVGYRTGFFDPSYFSKRFRAAMGASPRAYRQKFAGDRPVEADNPPS